MFKTKKRLALVLGIMILALTLGMTGVAQGATNALSVQFKNLKIYFNGQPATLGTQPLIVNGSTYLPVRALATLFDKNINWDATTQTITITDKTDTVLEGLKNQILVKDAQIKSLQDQLAAKKSSSSSSSSDLNDTEDNLNDDYNDFEDGDWDISLSGDEDDITVTVKIDLGDSDNQDVWDGLSNSDIEDFMQDIVDDILDDFDGADISGKIKDSDDNSTLYTFSVSSRGTVSLDTDLADFEETLNGDYPKLDSTDGIPINIVLDGDVDDEITFTVELDYGVSANKTYWDNELTDAEIESFMCDIQADIEDEFTDANVVGEIVNTDDNDDVMYELDRYGSGDRDSSY